MSDSITKTLTSKMSCSSNYEDCFMPFCKASHMRQNVAYYSIRPEWIPKLLNYVAKNNYHGERKLHMYKICAHHYSLCNLEEKILNTRIHFPFLKVSVSRHTNPKALPASSLFESDVQQLDVAPTIISERLESDTSKAGPIALDHSYAAPDVRALRDNCESTNAQNETLRGDIEILQQNSKEEIARLKKANDDLLTEKNNQEMLKVDHPSRIVVSNPASLRFYTGFSHKESFEYFINAIKAALHRLDEQCKPFRKRVFDFDSQIIMVLMRLKLDLLTTDLSHRFNVSSTTIVSSWNRWLDVMLQALPQEVCKLDLTDESQTKRVFIELDPILIVRKSLTLGQKIYSRGKSLLHLTPKGFIAFASDVYPSHLTDEEIMKLEKLGPDVDVYDADHDSEVLMQLHKILVISRSFNILRGAYIRSSSKIKLLHKHWKVVAYLTNFLFLQMEDDQLTIMVDPPNIDDELE